ncbi:MAG: hypothetical protein Q9227_008561 [Pyrenula ochraceoflavens]
MRIRAQDLRFLSSLLPARQNLSSNVTHQIRPRSIPGTPCPLRSCSFSITTPYSTSSSFTPSSHDSSSSVSSSEVSHFSRLAQSWWDPYGPSRLLHLMNPLRHQFLQHCLSSSQHPLDKSTIASTPYKPGLQLLDVGTGAGIFAESAARLPYVQSVLAIDPTEELIAAAQEHMRADPPLYTSGKLLYQNCSIEDIVGSKSDVNANSTGPSAESTTKEFNLISLFEVLEHVSHPQSFLRNISRLLNPGGWLVGSTISRSPVSYLTTKIIAEAPLIGLVPRGTHNWEKYIKPEELKRWLWKQGCWGEVEIWGCVYVPGLGWKWVPGSEGLGNYFFGVKRRIEE